MVTLSDRQHKILEFIIDFFKEREYPPTIREIGEKVGISSTSVVNYNLSKLEELELLQRRREVSRGLSVNWPKLVEHQLVEEAPVLPGANLTQERPAPTPRLSLVSVPVLGRIAAGEPIQVEPAERATAEEWVELPVGLLGTAPIANPETLFALRVRGNSMVDASVLDGDIVILRRQEVAENGEMVAVWIEGDEETTLKYWHLRGDKVHLEPANPTYQAVVRDADKVRVKGRVVSVIRYLH